MSACTCFPCGRSFTSLKGFDRHQDVDYTRWPPVVCRDPASLGMTADRRYGRWRMPATEAGRARLAALKARRVA
jgi:hypothetical protein